jgi:hypothetical protein
VITPLPYGDSLTGVTAGEHALAVTDDSRRVAGSPPGTEGAWGSVAIGLICVLVGVLLLVGAGLDGSAAIIAIGGLLCFAGLFVGNAGRQRLRARRVGRAADRCLWASVCYRSGNQYMLRAFVVDADGVHLYTLGGRRLAGWPWSTLANALAMPVAAGSSERPGVTLETADATPSVSFAFPPASGFGVSPAAADRVVRVVREHLAKR